MVLLFYTFNFFFRCLTSSHTKTDQFFNKKRFTITLRGILRVFNIQLIKQVFWSSIALTLNFTFICYAPSKKINPLQNINNVILNAYLIPLIYYFLKH